MNEIKEHPMLFSGEMVKAILSGQKTMTRRIVKPTQSEPKVPPLEMEPWIVDSYWEEDDEGRPYWTGSHPDYPTGAKWFTCPYGQPGERLWVRETALPDFPKEFSYYDWTWREVPDEYRKPEFVLYRASYPEPDKIKWHPSIHMPRWASRLTLEIASIKVERLQDITEEDAKAEGVGAISIADVPRQAAWSARHDFSRIWDAINAKQGFTWKSNPWVWAISFRRIKGE